MMSMSRAHQAGRPAFTLLEMILALAIGVLLMFGLYLALNMNLEATKAGRLQVDQAQIARNVLKRVQGDVKDQLAFLDAYPSATASASAAGGTGTTGTTTAATTSTTSPPNSFVGPTGTPVPIPFNFAVQGNEEYCAFYIGKVPRAVAQAQMNDPTESGGNEVQASDSDERRITYWLVSGSNGTGGLARQEIATVNSTDTSNVTLPPASVDDATKIIAPEVISINFQYYDGTNWQSTWDGTMPGIDGVTPVGPPVAIAITISVARGDNPGAGVDDPTVRQYRHVIQIPTASFYSNWPYNTLNPLATPQTTTTNTSIAQSVMGGGAP
jgi:prepilin-type N-terminal cleavage/methylation domain-containing protein